MKKYNHQEIEDKWQKKWLATKIYSPNLDKAKNPFYNLWMFPYPSGEGLHAGHAFASTGSDVIGRYMRMNGKSVFQPIGYDSFGIHSENYAIKTNQTPQEMLSKTIKHYGEQLKSLGSGYDWDHTVTTSDVDYYKWTEWVFVELFKAGLAYRKKAEVNFCPKDKTVLSDEQVMTPKQAGKEPVDAKGDPVPDREGLMVCERCGTIVEKRELEVWFFRITDYAEKLLKNLEKINWSERIKIAQKNWIGKKEGINITYPIKNTNQKLTCFTTRPDTNFGATFVVVAPEYTQKNLLKIIPDSEKNKVSQYINKSLNKSKQERIEEGTKKTGVFTGLYVINQLNGYEMPIWVSDFVLMDFGTGAVVGVPGHDKRDFEFARTFSLPIKRVVVGENEDKSEIKDINQVQEENGKMVNSDFLNGMEIHGATKKIMDYLETKKWGKRVVTYHLRDWGIGRQRYWGCPIPMIHCKRCAQNGKGWIGSNGDKLLHKDHSDWNWQGWWPEKNIPVELPVIKDYKPEGNGRGPLATHPEFYEVICPSCGATARRETDVADTFLDSSWYFFRYTSTEDKTCPWDPKRAKKWLPVNLYFGGAEHAVLHLMYARFITMVFNDLKLISFDEPFTHFFAHGLMIKDGAKMSKSRGNVVNPDKYIEKFGADTLRLYVMFLGQMDGYPDFRDTGIEGMQRFIKRVWDIFTNQKQSKDEKEITIKMHQTIKKVTEDIEIFHYNTAISTIMEFVNLLKEKGTTPRSLQVLCQLIAPFAPHMAEEIWVNILGLKYSVHTNTWPTFDPDLIKEKQIVMVIQINGKIRSQLKVESKKSEIKSEIEELSKQDPKISKWLKNSKINKVVFVPGKIINFVTANERKS